MFEYKGYNIVPDLTFGLKLIKSIGPGKIPNDLSGSYTNTEEAKKSINTYLELKGKTNAKAISAH